MSQRLVLPCIGLATAALGAGFVGAGVGVGALLLVVLLLPWLLGRWPRLAWMPSLGLVLHVAAAAAGLWLGGGTGWMLLAVITALVAWDLDGFSQRLKRAESVRGQNELERRHLVRLLAVALVGALLAALALGLRVQLAFGAVLVLGLLAIFGLSRAIRFLRRAGDGSRS
jgi:hypothetical protein